MLEGLGIEMPKKKQKRLGTKMPRDAQKMRTNAAKKNFEKNFILVMMPSSPFI